MFFLLGLVGLAGAGAVAGAGAASIIEGKKQTTAMIRNQENYTLMDAYVSYGTALVTAPGAVPI